MNAKRTPSRRQLFQGVCSLAALPLLSSCGTILYPDRAHQTERGSIDPAIIILDGIGLFFFLIPGVIAFAVDFATGAIYFPADHEPGDKERTIFDRHESAEKPDEQEIERVVALKTGQPVDLGSCDLRAMRIDHLDQFWMAYRHCSDGTLLAAAR